MGFELDPNSFGMGVGVGWASALGIYAARGPLGRLRRRLTAQSDEAQEIASRSAEGRYGLLLNQIAQRGHMLGDRIDLKDILAEPRFVMPPPFAAPPDEDLIHDVFRVIPRVHDLPFLHQPYNIDTLSVSDLSFGERAIALLGVPGSGRTTALHAIALWSKGLLEFEQRLDRVSEQLDEDMKSLKQEDRAQRMKELLAIEERARDQLAREQGIEVEEQQAQRGLSPFRRLFPVYIHLADVLPHAREFARGADPAEPLVRAVQQGAGYFMRHTIPIKLYDTLKNGRALLLLDGFDDLPPAEQAARLPWLRALIATYRANFFIVAGPAQGYGRLLQSGLTPVFLRSFQDPTVDDLAAHWAQHWPTLSGERRAQPPRESRVKEVAQAARGLTPTELSALCYAAYSDPEADLSAGTPLNWMTTTMQRFGLDDDALDLLRRAAALQLDEGFITLEGLEDLALGIARDAAASAATASVAAEAAAAATFADAPDDDEDLDALFGGDDDALDLETAASAPDDGDQASAERAAKLESAGVDRKTLRAIQKAQAAFVQAMVDKRLFTAHAGGRWLFRHRQVLDYAASLSLMDAAPDVIRAKASLPAWHGALGFAAGHTDISPAVAAISSQPPDVLYNHLLLPARWLAYTDGAVPWRAELLRTLGNAMIAPAQYPLLRERVAAALVGSRDSHVQKVFLAALKSKDPDVRRLGCLALGAMRDGRAVTYIAPHVSDPEREVQLAAGLALGAIGTPEAYETLVEVLATGEEQLRRAVAETFAGLPEEGYPILWDAVNEGDVALRRAAVFGLRRVPTSWALIAIYRTFLEDDQWAVRVAAEQAFQGMKTTEDARQLKPYPQVEAIPWLRDWLAALGEDAAELSPQDALLEIAADDSDPVMRAVAVRAVGQLGQGGAVAYLYEGLLNPDEHVRDSAHRALADLQAQIGAWVPAPA